MYEKGYNIYILNENTSFAGAFRKIKYKFEKVNDSYVEDYI